MMYLIFKELAQSASDVIMMTQSIMKDTGVGSDVLYKANAIRALCRIIDVCRKDVFCTVILKYARQPPCKQSSVPSRLQSSIEIPLFLPPLWFRPTTSFLLLEMWSSGGRAKRKKQLPRPSPPVVSPLASRPREASMHYSRVLIL